MKIRTDHDAAVGQKFNISVAVGGETEEPFHVKGGPLGDVEYHLFVALLYLAHFQAGEQRFEGDYREQVDEGGGQGAIAVLKLRLDVPQFVFLADTGEALVHEELL